MTISYVHQMFANTDMDEGRGAEVPIPGLFLDEATAELAAEGRGVYGSPAIVHAVPVFSTVESFLTWERESDPEYRDYLRLKNKFER